MNRPLFTSLKANYRIRSADVHDCSMVFPNTCAIRLSEALVRTDPKFLSHFKASPNNRCPHGYMRGAQDLAAVLAQSDVFGARDLGWGAQASRMQNPSDAVGKRGVICYLNIPNFSGQGHIDLWNLRGPVGSAYWNAETIWLWELP